MESHACAVGCVRCARRRFLQLAVGGAAIGIIARVGAPGRLRAAGAVLAQAPPQPPNPQMRAILDQFAALNPLPLETLTPRQARELPSFTDAARAEASRLGLPTVEPVGSIEQRIIPGGPGSDGTLVRIYTPASGRGPYPVLLYFHGGGFVIASINVYDPSARALANAAGVVVVSVAYRLAPEFPFPAAPEDAFAAYQWARANAASFGGDPGRVMVGGESAGGNLAAAVGLMARDRGAPLPDHQLLVYPASDFVNGANTPSAMQYADAKPLNRAALFWFGRYYLRSAMDAGNPYASPLYGALAGQPPATVITAEIDPLRDTGRLHAEALQAAGVPVVYRHFDGVTHEFFGADGVLDEAKQAVALAANRLRGGSGGAFAKA